MRPYRVLSIDGGGIRGIYSAVLLDGFAKRVAQINGSSQERLDVGKAFNLVVGTSTGALLSTAIASGVALEDVIKLYREQAVHIFPNPTPASDSRLKLWKWLGGCLNKPANTSAALENALTTVLGGETVKEMYDRRGISLCIPSIDAETHKAWVWKTPHDTKDQRLQRDNDYRLVDVCMSSAAAPLILPIHGVKKPQDPGGHTNWFVDGGLWANNPIMVALVEALSFAPEDAPIEIISVSTCPPFKAPMVDSNSRNRGLRGWSGGIGMMEMALDSQSGAYDYMAKALSSSLGDRVKYIRLSDPPVSTEIANELRMDNPSEKNIRALVGLANRAIDWNISEATTGDKSKALCAEVFSDLPALKS